MAQLTQNEHVDVLGLQSYLIKPLQRITKVWPDPELPLHSCYVSVTIQYVLKYRTRQNVGGISILVFNTKCTSECRLHFAACGTPDRAIAAGTMATCTDGATWSGLMPFLSDEYCCC
jgi:hypothetical protein